MKRPRSGSSSKPSAAKIRLRARGRSLILHELHKDAPFNHNLVAHMETVGNVILVAGTVTQAHMLAFTAAAGLGAVHKWQVLVVTQNRRNRNQQPGALLTGLNQHAHI